MAELLTNLNAIKAGELPIDLDPATLDVLKQLIAVPYTTTQPSLTPKKNGYRFIYFDGTNYFYYVYANAGWRNVRLGLPTDLNIASQAQGDILYFNGTNWVRLAAGTSGYFLRTSGIAANPAWAGTGLSASSSSTTSVANGAGEITIATITVPALGVRDGFIINLMVGLDQNSQAGDTLRIRIGASLALAFSAGNGSAATVFAQGYFFNSNSTSTNRMIMQGQIWQTFANNNSTPNI